MSDEKQEQRVNIEDLPKPEQELTDEEAKKIKGGLPPLLVPAIQKVKEDSAPDESASNIRVQGNRIGT